MNKILKLTLLLLVISSCNPASHGSLSQNDKGCTILTNDASSDKITFVLKFDTVNYTFEQTVGPKENYMIGCTAEDQSIKIVSAYISNK